MELRVKRSFKYKTAKAKMRLTTQQDKSYVSSGVNIVVKWKSRKYFWRIFDANMPVEEIKKRYRWQVIQKLEGIVTKDQHATIIENYRHNYKCCFAKIIIVYNQNHILLYFNHESSIMKAIYDSTEKDELGKGLQMKCQNGLI